MKDFPTPVNFIHAPTCEMQFSLPFRNPAKPTFTCVTVLLIINQGNSYLGLKKYLVGGSFYFLFMKLSIKEDKLFLRKVFWPKSVSLSQQL